MKATSPSASLARCIWATVRARREEVLAPIRGYNPSIPEYITWLQDGISKYKK